MHRIGKASLWLILAALCSSLFLLCPNTVISQTEHSYHPVNYTLVGATRYVSGSLDDLQASDEVYLAFQSGPSQVSPRSLYAHQETMTLADVSYYLSSLDIADKTGTSLSVPLSTAGRRLLGEFIYPLTGVTSILSSVWTVNYRAWFSNLTEGIYVGSPSWIQHAWWENAEYAYSSDDLYANSSNTVKQEYGSYGFSLPPTSNITKVEVGYEAYTTGDERITIGLSTDGGILWTSEQVSPSLGTTDQNAVGWIDFTMATNWTASMFSDGNFRSRVGVVKVGLLADSVFLDWLPVRVTYVDSPPTSHVDVDIRIRRSSGAIRQTIATNVADSESLSATIRTLSGTYSWSDYTVANETDYLEIDYYVDVLSANPTAIAHFRFDDSNSVTADQTRTTNIMLPSEYTAEVEFSGHSDTDYWSKITWVVDGSLTTENVFVTLQLYDYSQEAYPQSGDGYIAFLSSLPNADEMKTQVITTSTTSFRDNLGNWKMKIKCTKPAGSQFSLKLDLDTYQVTHVLYHDVEVSGLTYYPTSIYPRDIVAINVTVQNKGETPESFSLTASYNDNQIGRQTVANLTWDESRSLTFSWNTTGVMPGTYVLKAVADTVPNENDTANNILINGSVRVKGQPVAFFSHTPQFPVVEEAVTFNASLSTSEGNYITNYKWEFGDGNITVTSFSTVAHTYTDAGNYTVTLNVTNNDGLWDVDSKTIALDRTRSELSSPQWDWVWAMLGVPFMILLFTGIWWKRKRSKPNFADIEYLNEITDGGIPDSFSVMLVGSSDSGKNVLFQQLAQTFSNAGKPCVYVVYESFPDEIRENMKKLQSNASTLERRGELSYVDCFSSTAKAQSKEEYSLSQPFSLVDLGIIISRATNEIGNGVRVFLDSIVPLLTQLDPSRVVDFLQDRIARVKGIKGDFIFTLNKESMDPALMSRLEEIVDCIIEFDATQVKGEIARRLRIKKMRGRNASDRWVRFEIRPRKGIVFLV